MLDQALFVVCMLGPLAQNLFSMIAVVAGSENKTTTWILTLLHPLFDILQCLFQLMFILYGLKREPITSANAKEAGNQLRFGIQKHVNPIDPGVERLPEDNWGGIKMTYLKRRRSSITSIISRLAGAQLNSNIHQEQALLNVDNDQVSFNGENKVSTLATIETTSLNLPEIVISQPENENITSNQSQTESETHCNIDEKPSQHSRVKIVSECKVARPDKLRFWLRDIVTFLLVANASLWMFQSLNGTAFTIYQYESIFYGQSGWTTITMICRPLSIFFRMHSAGCLFEIWSFA